MVRDAQTLLDPDCCLGLLGATQCCPLPARCWPDFCVIVACAVNIATTLGGPVLLWTGGIFGTNLTQFSVT